MQNVHSIQQTVSVSQNSSSPIHEGSVVQGRVIAERGGNAYVVSVGGKQVAVRSEAALSVGQNFTAKVHIGKDQVLLSLVKEGAASGEVFQKFSSQSLSSTSSQSLLNLLSSLGLPQTCEGVRLLQFAQQLGINLKSAVLYRSYKTGSSFAGREEEASQIALELDSKGLASTYYAVDAVFEGFGKGSGRNEQKKGREHSSEEFLYDETDVTPSVIKDYFEDAERASVENEEGALTVFNQISTSSHEEKGNGNWFVFPFEWDYHDYSGQIKVFCSLTEKKLHEIVIDLKNHCQQWRFVLYYKANSLHSIRFSSDFQGGEQSLCEMLREVLAKNGADGAVSIEQVEQSILSGFCPEDSQILLVRGVL